MSDREHTMTCEHFALEVHDWGRRVNSRESEIRESIDERLVAHAAECPDCAQLLADVRALNYSLQALAEQDAAERAPESAEAALLAAFRAQKSSRRATTAAWHRAALAAAAIVLAALGVAVHRLVPTATGGSSAGDLQANSSEGMATAENSPLVAENATTFVALPYADENFAVEDGTIAQVTMSPATLASMGLPVADIDGAPMAAEVVLSEDGTPQAIRLLPENGDNTQAF